MTETAAAPSTLRSLLGRPLVVAIGANLVAWLFMVCVFWLGLRQWPSLALLSRADGLLYLDISNNGYELFRCTQDPSMWCGNTAWQPLYPILIRVVSLLGIAPVAAGLIITACAGVILSYVLARQTNRSGFALWRFALLVVFAPGMVWMHAVFPISLLLLWSALALGAARANRPALAGVWTALAVLTHSSGLVIALAVLLRVVFGGRGTLPKRLGLFLAPLGIAIGAWLLSLALFVGDWTAWWLVQEKYYRAAGGFLDKARALARHLAGVFASDGSQWLSVQSWLVLFMVLAGIVAVWRSRTQRRNRMLGVAEIVIMGLFPFAIGGQLSVSRNQAQSVLFLERLRIGMWAELLLLLMLAVVGAQIAQLFFVGVID